MREICTNMPLQLLTQAEARAQWTGDLTIVRHQRVAFEDLGVMMLRTLVVALVTLPLWRPLFHELAFFPYWLALMLAAGAFAFSHFWGKDILAARQPGAWLLVANRKTIWLHFRSYWHWRWPQDDKTVIRLDLEDIDFIAGVRVADKSPPQLAFRLHQPLPDEMVDRILEENNRLQQDRWGRGRVHHSPVVVERDAQTLRVRWSKEYPRIRETGDKLRLSFPIEPIMRIESADENVMEYIPKLTDADTVQINELLRQNDRIAAIKLLRNATGIGLKEAKEIIDNAGWQGEPETEQKAAGDDAGPR
jgi:hypothetical protein